MYPDIADQINSINDRLYDLMELFSKQMYVHGDFRGKSSLKNVLPVICNGLSYEGMNIADGGAACSSWKEMVFGEISAEEKKTIKEDLLKYCELDTWAMVKIWEEMKAKVV